MTTTVKLISGTAFTPASEKDVKAGLVGYVTLTFRRPAAARRRDLARHRGREART
jgi:hypothetical protein